MNNFAAKDTCRRNEKISQECHSLELSERLWMDERDYAGYFLALRPYSHIAILAMIRPHLGWHIVPLKLLKFIFIHIYGGGRGAKYFENKIHVQSNEKTKLPPP